MKKAVKVLMSTLFMLSALVMATSCQQDDMSVVDAKDVVIAAGTYDAKMVTKPAGQKNSPITSTVTNTATAEVKGTEPESEVIISDYVSEMKQITTYPTAEAYNFMKSLMGEQEGYSFDDSKRTMTFTKINKNEEDSTMTYKEFLENVLGISDDVKNEVIYQNKDGSKTKVEVTGMENGIEVKATITLTRK